jgi:excisionase family DNA binding protein
MEKPNQAVESVPGSAFMAPRHLCRLLGISRRTLRRWVATKLLPAPMRLGRHGQTLRWRHREIFDFLAAATEVGLVKPKVDMTNPACERGREEPV